MIAESIVCLALAMYHEARGEGPIGMLSVGQTAVNRMKDDRWPKSACQVIKQGGENPRNRCQFSFWCDGKSDTPKEFEAWQEAKQLADRLIRNHIKFLILEEATCYHAIWLNRKPVWAKNSKFIARIGNHDFYRC